MAYKFGHTAIVTFGGTAVTGIINVTFDPALDSEALPIAGLTVKQHVTGLEEATITVDFHPEDDDVTLLATTLAAGANGTLNVQPFGNTSGNIEVDVTSATVIESPGFDASTTSAIGSSVTFGLDDYTIQAITP